MPPSKPDPAPLTPFPTISDTAFTTFQPHTIPPSIPRPHITTLPATPAIQIRTHPNLLAFQISNRPREPRIATQVKSKSVRKSKLRPAERRRGSSATSQAPVTCVAPRRSARKRVARVVASATEGSDHSLDGQVREHEAYVKSSSEASG